MRTYKTQMDKVLSIVCNEYGFDCTSIDNKSRLRDFVLVRQTVWSIMNDIYGRRISFKELGGYFSKCHSTALQGVNSLNKANEFDKEGKTTYLKIKRECEHVLINNEQKLKLSQKIDRESITSELIDVLKYKDFVCAKVKIREIISTLKD